MADARSPIGIFRIRRVPGQGMQGVKLGAGFAPDSVQMRYPLG
ncbi:hypothetical protein HMPREF0742_02385 [Rothia aeria F0184]|uniref:Uncharacterized protein n=1 Tax=Rothia aeria F0184 TaxID=888019 RepID=U7UXY9_9MICC|nr:hypothetical protein HMPREF0742_02385 [Rothia aeria F0184]